MTNREMMLFTEMLAQSFEPRQWFEDRCNDEPNTNQEERIMWVYRQTQRGEWTVGFYAPDGTWNKESDWDDRDEAADRVHYLNGGGRASEHVGGFGSSEQWAGS